MPNGFNAMHNFEGGNAEMPDGRHEYLANARARMDHVGRWLREPRYRDFTANREHMSDLYHRFQTGANLAARARYNEGVDRWQHLHNLRSTKSFLRKQFPRKGSASGTSSTVLS
jgi:hypothetical protein